MAMAHKLTKSASFDDLTNSKLDHDELISHNDFNQMLPSEVSSLQSEEDVEEDDDEQSSGEFNSSEFYSDEDEEETNIEISNCPVTDNSFQNIERTESNKIIGKTNEGRGLPSSCVFVASLAATLSDDKLCLSVKEKFKEFGKLNGVKVLRDQENRPYAFVQYTNDRDASVALDKAHGSMLDGRIIRCEPARVNRTLFISHSTPITFSEVKRLCLEFGKLEQLVPSRDKNSYSQRYSYPVTVSMSWFVRFVYRDDAIRSFANLKTEPNWSVQWAQNINVPKRFNLLLQVENNDDNDKVERLTGSTGQRNITHHNASVQHENAPNITIDKKSIFVGQLPQDTTVMNLKEHFSKHGQVIDVNLIHKPINVFAFIQFETESAAAAALEKENHSIFLDKTIHVQYKEIGGFHGKKSFRRNSQTNVNNNRNNQFNGPQLNLAPPPISMYRRRSYEINNNNNSNGNPHMNNNNSNGTMPFIHYYPPNMPGSIPNFDPNMYGYMNGVMPPSFRRGSMPETWSSSRGTNENVATNRSNSTTTTTTTKKHENDPSVGTTDAMTEVTSEISDSPGRNDATNPGVNSTTTYNNSSAGSIGNNFTTKKENKNHNGNSYQKSNNNSEENISFNESMNPYYFQHYYYPPVPYPMGPPHSPQGSVNNNPYMMYYSVPPHGMVPGEGMMPMNFPMNMNSSGSLPDASTNFQSFNPAGSNKLKKEKEYLDY